MGNLVLLMKLLYAFSVYDFHICWNTFIILFTWQSSTFAWLQSTQRPESMSLSGSCWSRNCWLMGALQAWLGTGEVGLHPACAWWWDVETHLVWNIWSLWLIQPANLELYPQRQKNRPLGVPLLFAAQKHWSTTNTHMHPLKTTGFPDLRPFICRPQCYKDTKQATTPLKPDPPLVTSKSLTAYIHPTYNKHWS